MAAPSHVGIGPVFTGSGNAEWPSGYVAGDYALLFIETTRSATPTTPGGWSVVGSVIGANNQSASALFVYGKEVSASEAVVPVSSTDHCVGYISVYRGVDTADPIDDLASTNNNGTAAVNISTVTASDVDRLLVVVLGCGRDSAAEPVSSISHALGTLTEEGWAATTTGNGGGVQSFNYALSSAGSTGSGTITQSATAYSVTLALLLNPTAALPLESDGSITFTHDATLSSPLELASTESIAFTASAALTSVANLSSTSTIAFGGSAALSLVTPLESTGVIAFDHSGDLSLALALESEGTVVFGHDVTLSSSNSLSSMGTIGFSHSAALNSTFELGHTGLIWFSHQAEIGLQLDLESEGNISFTHSVSPTIRLLASHEGSIAFDHFAILTSITEAVADPGAVDTFLGKWSELFVAKQAVLAALASRIRGTSDGVVDTYVSSDEPLSGELGDLWLDVDTDTVARWEGSSWISDYSLNTGSHYTQFVTAAEHVDNAAALSDGVVRSFWADSPPAIGGGTGAEDGDIWFDTMPGAIQYIWDGTKWAQTSSGITIYAQDDEPVGTFRVNDLWIDTDDGNRMYRWSGTEWVEAADARIDANASAISTLSTTITALESSISTVASSVTSLEASLDTVADEVEALATAQDSLTASVTSIAGSRATVFVQPTEPSHSGRVNGDIWVDSDDGNKMYIWETTDFVLRGDQDRVQVYAQDSEPSPIGLVEGSLWFDTDDNNKQYRWDGSDWVNVSDARITSQASAITALQAAVSLLPAVYVQDSEPTGGSYTVGDMWFDSDDGNKQYVWNGTAWDDTAVINGATVYAQTGEPTGGSYSIGDLWIDTDDNNRMYRWNGGSWVDVSDSRIGAQGTAISALDTRVTAAEGQLTSQASSITSLTSAVGTKARVYLQTEAPASGMVAGDLWIDSDDSNKLYRYSGSAWVLIVLDAGARTFYQGTAPASPRLGDLWIDTSANNLLKRWDGSSWQDMSDTRIAGTASALSALTSTVIGLEEDVTSQASSITALESGLAIRNRVFVSASPPVATGTGDLWFDSDDNNRMYTWTGSAWSPRPQPTGSMVYVQASAPGTGDLNDIWIDSDDGNRMYRWDGTAWTPAGDTRIAANATAITNLTSQVSSKTTNFVQGIAPSTAGRVIGDLWINTANNNQVYAWNGSSWVLYSDGTKVTTFAQTTAPPSAGRVVGDLWVDTGNGNRLKRWDGSSWVDVTDARTSAAADAITQLNAEVAGKADVSVVNALSARVETTESIYNVNLIPNSGFKVDIRGWVKSWDSENQNPPQHLIERDMLGSGYVVPDTHNIGIRYPGTVPGASGSHFYAIRDFGSRIPIVPGEKYIFSASLAKNEAAPEIMAGITMYKEDGGSLGDPSIFHNTSGYTGGTNRANWVKKHTSFVAPANAAYALVTMRLKSTKGVSNNPAGWVMEPMLERVPSAQSTPSVFNLGPTTAWAEWDLTFDVSGNIGGIRYANDGSVSNFKVSADAFEVVTGTDGTGLTLKKDRMDRKFSAIATYEGDPFGADNLILWIGPSSIPRASATQQNAIFCVGDNGGSYFGGSLNPGYIVNGQRTTNTANDASVTLGPFVTYGGSKQVKVNYSWRNNGNTPAGNVVSTYNNKQFTATVKVESSTNGISWTDRGNINCSAYSVAEYDTEQNITMVSIGLAGSLMYTDNSAQTANMHLRATLLSRNTPFQLTWPNPPQQIIAIKSVE